MDDITPVAVKNQNAVDQPVGCSTLCVNQPDCVSSKWCSESLLLLVSNTC